MTLAGEDHVLDTNPAKLYFRLTGPEVAVQSPVRAAVDPEEVGRWAPHVSENRLPGVAGRADRPMAPATAARFAEGVLMKAFLVAEEGPLAGQRFALKGRMKIGRGSTADISVQDTDASRHHAELEFNELKSVWVVTDLGSTNGTYVDGQPIASCVLAHGKLIAIGESAFRFIEADQVAPGSEPDDAGGKTMLMTAGAPAPAISEWQTIIDLSRLGDAGALPSHQLSATRLNDLVQLGLIMNEADQAEDLFDRVVGQLAQAFKNARAIAILLACEDEDALDIVATCSSSGGYGPSVPLSATIVTYAISEKQAIVASDVPDDDRFRDAVSLAQYDITSAMCAPMLRHDEMLGAIYVAAVGGIARFGQEDLTFLNHVACHLGLVVRDSQLMDRLAKQNTALEETIEELSSTMTGVRLANAFRVQMGRVVPAAALQAVTATPESSTVVKTEKDISVLYLDISGYAGLFKALDPSGPSVSPGRYLGVLMNSIYQSGGELAETVADGLLVVFENEDPNGHPQDAAGAAMMIRESVFGLNQELAEGVAPLEINMAINSGTATVEDAQSRGQTRVRWSLAVSGATVEVAKDFAALAQDGLVLLAPETAKRLPPKFGLQSLGTHFLSSTQGNVEVFALM